jgi:hypothetical protein
MSPEEIIALLRQKQLSPETINLLSALDGSTVALINLLLYFLDFRGVINRQEFLDFLESELAKYEAGKPGDYVQQFLKMKVDGLSKDPPAPN